jgi:hypothetical protein
MKENLSHSREDNGLSGFMLGIIIAVLFICWGLIIFFLVGDKVPPAWDFSVVEDIPGQSPYSTNRF